MRLNLDLVDAIGQAPGIKVAPIVRSERITVVVGLANEFNCALQAQSRWIGDGQTQFPGGPLRFDRKSEERKSEQKENREIAASVFHE